MTTSQPTEGKIAADHPLGIAHLISRVFFALGPTICEFGDVQEQFLADAASCERMLIAAVTASPFPSLLTLLRQRLHNSRLEATIILADPEDPMFASTHPDPTSAEVRLHELLSGLGALVATFPQRLRVFKVRFPFFQSLDVFDGRLYAFLHQYMQRSADSPVLCVTSSHGLELIHSAHAMAEGPHCIPVKGPQDHEPHHDEKAQWRQFIIEHKQELEERYGLDATLIFDRDTREVKGAGQTAGDAFDSIKGSNDFPMVIASISDRVQEML